MSGTVTELLCNKQPSMNRRLWLLTVANLPDVNPLTVANSELPPCYPSRAQTWEEMHGDVPLHRVSRTQIQQKSITSRAGLTVKESKMVKYLGHFILSIY